MIPRTALERERTCAEQHCDHVDRTSALVSERGNRASAVSCRPTRPRSLSQRKASGAAGRAATGLRARPADPRTRPGTPPAGRPSTPGLLARTSRASSSGGDGAHSGRRRRRGTASAASAALPPHADRDGGHPDAASGLETAVAVDDDVLRPVVEVVGAVGPVAQVGVDRDHGDGDGDDDADLEDALRVTGSSVTAPRSTPRRRWSGR